MERGGDGEERGKRGVGGKEERGGGKKRGGYLISADYIAITVLCLR